ncbi:MAG: hypothetical protein IIY77_01815 [Lachnospiraceae bacterium]|nr:hypothetical protein [Lachnospiraceae bacterium]
MKKLTALFLAFSLVLSLAACGSRTDITTSGSQSQTTEKTEEASKNVTADESEKEAQPEQDDKTTGSGEEDGRSKTEEASSEEETEKTELSTEPETTEEALTPEDGQPYYEMLFSDPEKVKFAGRSMKIVGSADGVEMNMVYEYSGSDYRMLMQGSKTGYGFGTYAVNGESYIYVKYTGAQEGAEEHFYHSDTDISGMMQDKPDFSFENTDKVKVRYLGEEDGLAKLELTNPEDEETMALIAFMNEKDEIVRMEVASGDADEMSNSEILFYDVEKIDLPDIEVEEGSAEKVQMAVFAALMCMMPEGILDPTDDEDPDNDPNDPEQTTEHKYTLENAVLVDNGSCFFRIDGVKDDSLWGFTLKTYAENRTPDTKLTFTVDSACINGYMIDTFYYEEIPAGKKSSKEISFTNESLKEAGIDVPEMIELRLEIRNSEDYSAQPVVKDVFYVFPTGKTADEVEIPERKTTDEEKVIVDNDVCSFIIQGTEEDDFWGSYVVCYLENKTEDKVLMFSWDDVSVNGYMTDPYFGKVVTPGARTYAKVSFDDDFFEENHIDSLEEIEFKLRVYDDETWDEYFVDDVFTYEP